MVWRFFQYCHGKGKWDGEGTTVKYGLRHTILNASLNKDVFVMKYFQVITFGNNNLSCPKKYLQYWFQRRGESQLFTKIKGKPSTIQFFFLNTVIKGNKGLLSLHWVWWKGYTHTFLSVMILQWLYCWRLWQVQPNSHFRVTKKEVLIRKGPKKKNKKIASGAQASMRYTTDPPTLLE